MPNFNDAIDRLKGNPVNKGDRASHAAASWRMEAIQQCLESLANGEQFQRAPGVRIRRGRGGLMFLGENTGRRRGGSAAQKTPFLVYPGLDNTVPPYPILKVYPGKIAGITPTLNNALLTVKDTDPGLHPWFYAPGTNFTFFLKCKVELDPTNLFRPAITEVKVTTDDLDAQDIDGSNGDEIPPLKMFWDDGDTHKKGHFYIKIADVEMTTNEGNIIFVGKTQDLITSYVSFVVADVEVIPVI